MTNVFIPFLCKQQPLYQISSSYPNFQFFELILFFNTESKLLTGVPGLKKYIFLSKSYPLFIKKFTKNHFYQIARIGVKFFLEFYDQKKLCVWGRLGLYYFQQNLFENKGFNTMDIERCLYFENSSVKLSLALLTTIKPIVRWLHKSQSIIGH